MKRFTLTILLVIELLLVCHAQPKANSGTHPVYDVHVKVIPDMHLIQVDGTMHATPSDPLRRKIVFAFTEKATDVKFDVVAYDGNVDTIRLEKIDRQGVSPGLRRWAINLHSAVPAGSTVKVKFSYRIENQLDSVFYIGPEGTFASGTNTAWYPEQEAADQFRIKGVGVLRIDVPKAYVAYATGSKGDITSQTTTTSSFEFKPDSPAFFSFAVGKFTVRHKTVGGLSISIYVLRPRPARQLDSMIDGCGKIINALAQEFGPYPYKDFGIVEMPTEQARKSGSDGASLSGFMLGISSYFDQEFNTAFYGHEIAHTWWGNLIQRKGSTGSYMLDEAMANYGSLRAVELIDGADAAEQYRRTGYPGYYSEYSGSVFLQRALAGLDHSLADLPVTDGFLSRRLANTKGMLVWDMLSRTIGRKRFSSILRDIGTRWANQRITWEEFLDAIARRSGRDLKWFYDQWFHRTGAPEWDLAWTQNAQTLRGSIVQKAPFYNAQLQVQAIGLDGRTLTRLIEVRGPRTEFTWPVGVVVKRLTLDPNFKVLRWTPEYREKAEAILPFTKADLKLSQGQTAEASKDFREAVEHAPDPDFTGLRFLLEYGLAQSLIEQHKMDEALIHVNAALALPIRPAETLPWVYVQMAQIAKALKDDAALRRALNSAIAADRAAGGRTGAVDQVRILIDNSR